MVTLVWNLFKKLALRSISGGKKEFRSLFIMKEIIPETLIQGENIYDFTWTHNKYLIDGFIINYFISINERPMITSVSIFGGSHPNADSNTRVFCLPNHMKNKELTPQYVIDLRKTMSIWNLNSCHFMPNPADYKTRRRK